MLPIVNCALYGTLSSVKIVKLRESMLSPGVLPPANSCLMPGEVSTLCTILQPPVIAANGDQIGSGPCAAPGTWCGFKRYHPVAPSLAAARWRSEEHTSELQSPDHL